MFLHAKQYVTYLLLLVIQRATNEDEVGDLKIEGPLVQLEGEGYVLKESYYDGYGDDEDDEDRTPFEETKEGSPFEDGEGGEGYTPFEGRRQ